MTERGKAGLILIGMMALITARAPAQTEEANNVLGQAGPSVLAIISYGSDKAEILKGSALALGEDIVVTAYHAVSQAYDVEGRNIKGKKVKIEGIIGVDKEHDIALLRPKGKIDALPVGSVESLTEGARIFALGSNESGDVTIVEGTFVKTVELGPQDSIFEVTLAVPDQFRGGPVVDLNGQLVGMLFVGERNLKFGIPIATLVSVTRTGSVMEFKSQTQENYFETVVGNKFAGRAALALDDQLAARTHFERAVKADPSDLQGHLVLAGILSRQRDYSAAVSAYRKVTELDPGNAEAYYGLGTILHKQTQYKEAAAALEKAAASGYAGPTLYFDLGGAYEAVPDFAKAAEAYEKYIASGPDDAWAAYLRLGICRTSLEQYDEAVAALLEARKSQPNDVKVGDALAQAYVKAGRLEDAEAVYDALAGLNPPEAKNYYRLAYQMYEGAGRFDRAIAPLQKIIELDPNNETNYYYLGMTHFKAEQYDEAVAAFEKSLALKPDFPHAWYQIGSSHFNAKRYRQAAEAYKSYVELTPDDASGWLNIGVSYNQAKNYEAALEPLKKCVELKPEDPVALANLAIVYINLKDNYSAKEIYNKLVTVDPAMAEKLKKYIY
ncbi:MAG: tetratricopeptide repeat protein [Candidatus Aminicenantes bacterium]|nr:tetratricopeptide repeat protein [Candidatus Aminicenantes bacterium]